MNTTNAHCYAVILAGGSGVRLWPLSRESMPKQLIPVLAGKSLMEAAFDRLQGVIPPERRWVCGGARYETVVKEKIPGIGRYIGEPEGRDTLPAIALSCALMRKEHPDAIIAFLTSDHVIEPVERFREDLRTAFAAVEAHPDALVTFGVKPTFAATAYGTIASHDADGNASVLADGTKAQAQSVFVESRNTLAVSTTQRTSSPVLAVKTSLSSTRPTQPLSTRPPKPRN